MSHPPRSKQSSATSHALRFPNTTSLRLPLREQVQRLHRGQVREIQMGQLDQDRIGRRDGEEAELLGVARVGRALASRFELGEQRLGSRDDGIGQAGQARDLDRSEEHTSELQSHSDLVCRLLLEKKKKTNQTHS